MKANYFMKMHKIRRLNWNLEYFIKTYIQNSIHMLEIISRDYNRSIQFEFRRGTLTRPLEIS